MSWAITPEVGTLARKVRARLEQVRDQLAAARTNAPGFDGGQTSGARCCESCEIRRSNAQASKGPILMRIHVAMIAPAILLES